MRKTRACSRFFMCKEVLDQEIQTLPLFLEQEEDADAGKDCAKAG